MPVLDSCGQPGWACGWAAGSQGGQWLGWGPSGGCPSLTWSMAAGPRPFTCPQCGKAFPKAYLLKKHQEVHVHERRFRCGDCGKLYKTIAHVRGHRRVHSDERPYPCPECGKRYKTKVGPGPLPVAARSLSPLCPWFPASSPWRGPSGGWLSQGQASPDGRSLQNAQQVHFRTHLEEKPHVCPFCSRGFREKGSLVRHVRHHTGEKPFKCYKCGRGFAEHGTLNRHLRTKGRAGSWQVGLAGGPTTSAD